MYVLIDEDPQFGGSEVLMVSVAPDALLSYCNRQLVKDGYSVSWNLQDSFKLIGVVTPTNNINVVRRFIIQNTPQI